MSTSRNKKRGAPKDDRDYDYSQANKEGPKKKTKQAGVKESSSENLNNNVAGGIDIFSIGLIATTVFSYLKMRDLLRLANSSQFLRAQLKHEHVISGALMHGGHAKESMVRLARLIEDRKIWIPSPLRLLRLVNGKRCEKCNKGKANMVNPHFGVFFCWGNCIKKSSKKVAINNKWAPFLRHPRVASAQYFSNAYVLKGGFCDKTGEMAGPLIGMKHMDLFRSGKCTLEGYLVAMDRQDPHAKSVDEILGVFKGQEEEAEQEVARKKAEKEAATQTAIERKKAKTAAMLEKLSKAVSDDKPWKEYALRHSWVTNTTSSSGLLIQVHSHLVHSALLEVIKSPSKATKKKIAEIVEYLTEAFDLIWESHLHDFAFLSETNQMERILKSELLKQFSNYRHLNSISGSCIESLKEAHSPFQFLVNHLSLGCFSFSSAFGPSIVQTISYNHGGDAILEDPNVTLLAENLWTHFSKTHGYRNLPEVYQSCVEQFPSLYQSLMDFLGSPGAKIYLGNFALNRSDYFVWKEVATLPNIEHLLNHDFEAVLNNL